MPNKWFTTQVCYHNVLVAVIEVTAEDKAGAERQLEDILASHWPITHSPVQPCTREDEA